MGVQRKPFSSAPFFQAVLLSPQTKDLSSTEVKFLKSARQQHKRRQAVDDSLAKATVCDVVDSADEAEVERPSKVCTSGFFTKFWLGEVPGREKGLQSTAQFVCVAFVSQRVSNARVRH